MAKAVNIDTQCFSLTHQLPQKPHELRHAQVFHQAPKIQREQIAYLLANLTVCRAKFDFQT